MDLGCSGGGMVRSFLEDGHTAIGLEGSDVSKKLRTGEWDNCPLHLFTADITSPFEVRDSNDQPMKFDLITSWEVLEHITENKLPGLMENIRNHLAPGGIFVGSVAMFPDADPSTGAVYHVTLQSQDWWLAKFAEHGFKVVRNHPYLPEDYVRGNGMSLKDWYPGDGLGFHVVLSL
jgi:cyclopropane fatty-acyl-phospholipid synthase-like methyltransferase